MTSNIYKFTSNGEIDEYPAKDTELKLKGYVECIEGFKSVSKDTKNVFKVIVNNTMGRKVRLLFWNDRAQEFVNKISLGTIINIRGAYGHKVYPTYADSPCGIVADIELSVNKNTKVELLGTYNINKKTNEIISVEFQDLNKIQTNLNSTNAYIKQSIVTNEFNGATYGSGVLTDGIYRVRIQVSNFDPTKAKNYQEGCHVNIIGEVRLDKGGVIIIYIANMDKITKTKEKPLTQEELENGYRPLKRKTPFGDDVLCSSEDKILKLD